jgi:hypothetical protein
MESVCFQARISQRSKYVVPSYRKPERKRYTVATVPNVPRPEQPAICVPEIRQGRRPSSSSLAQLEQPDTSPKMPGNLAKRINFIERFRSVLATRELTVNSLSKKTEQLFGAPSSYFIPHNFCYNIVAYGLTPHICQVFALSKITGYSFTDLLIFFGFPPNIISRHQSKMHTQRTILLPSASYDQDALLPYFGSRVKPELMDSTCPLSRIISRNPLSPVHKIKACNRKSYLYARIGTEDALAFPDLVPGSIVRVDPLRCSVEEESARKDAKPPIYLVEHSLGLTCCHVSSLGRDRILLTPPSLVFEPSRELPSYSMSDIAGRLGSGSDFHFVLLRFRWLVFTDALFAFFPYSDTSDSSLLSLKPKTSSNSFLMRVGGTLS